MANNSYSNTSGFMGGYVEPVQNVTSFPLTVTPSATSILLEWGQQGNAFSYDVYVGLSLSDMQPYQTQILDLFCEVQGLVYGVKYMVQVTARYGAQSTVGSIVYSSITTDFGTYNVLSPSFATYLAVNSGGAPLGSTPIVLPL